ncbi:ATP-binding protein [Streptomyces sp. I05A-00742]|uniref:ATP-binding protein n=1 Tax=Streptomyces sp. I05A-00742 TaxID=2732853 RepID=UPI0014885873|nr:ATP-binding protein [Streptomyces sp. I05A-00742]
MMPITEAVSLGLVAGTATAAVIAAPLLVRARRLTARLRDELATATGQHQQLTAYQRAWESELDHLVGTRLPAVLEGAPEVPGPLHGGTAPADGTGGTAFGARHEALLDRTATTVRRLKAREDSGRAAFLVMADRIQVMALAQQQGLDVLEQSAEDPVLMAGLMRADHAAAQLARQAQTMKVLCGAWPGRQWPEAVSLLDVVRGAQSRILEYQRVRVQGARDAAVEPRAVEALIHAVAELLDNATRYSPPTVTVLVGIRPVHSGAVIEIDDGGLGMTEQALAEAEVRLGGGAVAEGRGLGAKPQLGLAAVGMLARRYGFSVKLDSPSAYGGVRAVVLVPSALLTQGPAAPATPAPPRAPGLREHAQEQLREHAREQMREHAREQPREPVPEDAPAALPQHTRPEPTARQDMPRSREQGLTPERPREQHPTPEPPATTPGGLPRRRSRRAANQDAPEPVRRAAPAAEPVRSPQQAADFMSSLQTGTRQGREEAAASAGTPQATMAAEGAGPAGAADAARATGPTRPREPHDSERESR